MRRTARRAFLRVDSEEDAMTTTSTGNWIVTSGGPAPEIPDLPLPDFLLAGRPPDRPAIVDGPSGRGMTYGQLADGVRCVAAGFAARGLRPGDAVALLAPNSPEWLLTAYGVMAAGGVVTGVNPLCTAREVAGQLADADARFLVTVPPFLPAAREAVAGRDTEIVLIGLPAEITTEGTTAFADLVQYTGEPPDVRLDPATDLALQPYSSGTSGLPKGVMLTHRACVANVVQQEYAIPFRGDDRVLAVAPFFHAVGFGVVANGALHAGATLITMPRFDVEQFLELIERYRVTATIVVPPIVLALAKHPAVDHADLRSLRFVGCGAAPLGAAVQQAAADRVGCPVLQGWGMTEMVAGGAIWRLDTPIVPGAAGMLFPGLDARVVELADGTDLPPGEAGELLIRTVSVMAGYRGAPGATAATVDADGWLHTGDVATVSADGVLHIVDRVKELIKVKGFQVAPAELEAVLRAHPDVAEAAVVPMPDEMSGEVPKAFVVRVPGSTVSAEDIIDYVAGRVARYKRVRAVEFIEAVPTSPAGKTLRRLLRA
jgi:acyl-CoA synthetase (AMP-forming)/AMP-acid ligase II